MPLRLWFESTQDNPAVRRTCPGSCGRSTTRESDSAKPTMPSDTWAAMATLANWQLELEDPAAVAEPRNEIDGVAWLSPTDASDRLSYDRDRAVLRAVVDDGKTAPR